MAERSTATTADGPPGTKLTRATNEQPATRPAAGQRADAQRRALISAAIIAGLGPTIVAVASALLSSSALGLADLYFGVFKNSGFLLPVIAGLLLSVTGALPGIIILSESFQSGRRVAAGLTILWAVVCLALCLSLSDFA